MSHIIELENEIDKSVDDVLSHSICVSNVAYRLAYELELTDEQCYDIAIAGVVHDIGKIRLVSYMMQLEEEEYTLQKMRYMRMHSILSYDILKDRGYSDFILDTVLYHHENYDGSGYPYNLKGEDIPIGARILRVSDVFAALVSDRIYRDALDIDSAVEVMIDEVKNYDMKIFLAFQRILHEVNIQDIIDTERNLRIWQNQ